MIFIIERIFIIEDSFIHLSFTSEYYYDIIIVNYYIEFLIQKEKEILNVDES